MEAGSQTQGDATELGLSIKYWANLSRFHRDLCVLSNAESIVWIGDPLGFSVSRTRCSTRLSHSPT